MRPLFSIHPAARTARAWLIRLCIWPTRRLCRRLLVPLGISLVCTRIRQSAPIDAPPNSYSTESCLLLLCHLPGVNVDMLDLGRRLPEQLFDRIVPFAPNCPSHSDRPLSRAHCRARAWPASNNERSYSAISACLASRAFLIFHSAVVTVSSLPT